MKYFTADWHVDHANAMNFPGRIGMTLEEWNGILFENTNSILKAGDTLYMLGDFAFKNPQLHRPKIKCKDIWLIVGNHDPSYSQCCLAFGQNKVVTTLDTHCKGVSTFLSHYPHLHWPASHHGSFHLFGHVHMQREAYWDGVKELSQRRSLDVCPEHAKKIFGELRPFSEDEVYDILIKKEGHDNVSWYQENKGKINYAKHT